MRIRTLAWQFFFVCFVVTSVSLWITTWYAAHTYKQFYLKTVISDVSTRAQLLKREFSSLETSDSRYLTTVDSLCKHIGKLIATRITVILPSGKVIGDSEKLPDSMDNHANRPEIIQALSLTTGVKQRFSTTLNEDMLYVALPLTDGDTVESVVRLAVSLNAIHKHGQSFYAQVVIVSILTCILIAFASYYISRRLSKPIRQMRNGAQKFAAGDLAFKLPVPAGDELGGLARSLNSMAQTLDERFQIIINSRNELNAILHSMAEGVVAVDMHENIISLNPAAARMFSITGNSVKGKWLHEIVRNSSLQKIVSRILGGESVNDTTISLISQERELHIRVSGAMLNDRNEKPIGAVLVLNDITRIHQLENIRKEFVASVSHELRTPLTSIKGFIETISIGNYNLPDEVNQFVGIIAKKTDRLCLMVDDILALSSIERDHEHREISFTRTRVLEILDEVIRTCTAKAKLKNIILTSSCSPVTEAILNAPLIEEAINNLLDNAIKYSEENTTVSISAVSENDGVVIAVTDRGIGISAQHLERIFERFYRVDKARSRKLGGTGLGLSIVKNIAVAHGGRVTVESSPGKGSTFRIHIPYRAELAGDNA
jgi:two-component system, OmpR family, phosphate regulon sensor histidine kinase PhoR